MTIEKHVWIGFRSVVIGAACIGAGSIVGANSFVNKPVKPASLVGGVPARLLKTDVSWSRHARWVDPADVKLARALRTADD
jgi:serine acetyltransferase